MDIFTEKIFKNKIFDSEKLLKFGFKRKYGTFVYTQTIMDGQFFLEVEISGRKDIKTKLTDSLSKDEYTLHLLEEASGTFVGEVRENYEAVLGLIAEKCCQKRYFMTEQANRLTDLILAKYGDTPEFLWEKFPGFGVFRNPESRKWYGLISVVDRSKLVAGQKGKVEILNLKLEKSTIESLQNVAGFFPAYHMNKKNWVTIILDGTVSDGKIMLLVEESNRLSAQRKWTQRRGGRKVRSEES